MEFVCMCVVVVFVFVVVVVVLWGADPFHSLSGGHTQYVSYTKFTINSQFRVNFTLEMIIERSEFITMIIIMIDPAFSVKEAAIHISPGMLNKLMHMDVCIM